jgi:uncharacterized membrane protein
MKDFIRPFGLCILWLFWHSLLPVGACILWGFGIFFPVFVCCAKIKSGNPAQYELMTVNLFFDENLSLRQNPILFISTIKTKFNVAFWVTLPGTSSTRKLSIRVTS